MDHPHVQILYVPTIMCVWTDIKAYPLLTQFKSAPLFMYTARTGALMGKQTQRPLFFITCLNLPAALPQPLSFSLSLKADVPNALSAHPSRGEADDWPPRTATHNNSLCMVTVTEERKLPNPPRYNLLKIAAIKNPRCLLHPDWYVCVCGCMHA